MSSRINNCFLFIFFIFTNLGVFVGFSLIVIMFHVKIEKVLIFPVEKTDSVCQLLRSQIF